MIKDIQKLLDEYLVWLKDKTLLRQINGYVEITTPYLDRHNDYLQIYAKPDEGGFKLTDDGYILEDLKNSGCELDSKKRKDLLDLTLNGFGVKLTNNNLTVHASKDNFSLRKHNLIQAMLAVNDLFYLATPMIKGLFLEDVASWLEQNEIRFTPRVKFTGKSGYDHMYDFVIPPSKEQPERILKTINSPGSDTAKIEAFSWIDTKKIRPKKSEAFVFLNDSEHTPPSSMLEALSNYDIYPVLWSKRNKVKDKLAA